MEYQSQIGQDRFVTTVLRDKVAGTFLDIGCWHWRVISNTCYLELELGWSGWAIDIDDTVAEGWERHRPASQFICADAVAFPYASLSLPPVVDYLSIDLEPPPLALDALKAVLETGTRFRVITFEHDTYRGFKACAESRKLLGEAGYQLALGGHQDDFWIDTELCGCRIIGA